MNLKPGLAALFTPWPGGRSGPGSHATSLILTNIACNLCGGHSDHKYV